MSTVVRSSGGAWLRSWTGIGTLFLMFAAATLLASCGQEQGQQGGGGGEETAPSGEEAESAGQAQAVSLADITDNPSEFYGKTVTVSGLVTDELGPDSFAIGGDEFVGGESLPVLGAQQLDQIVQNPELLEESQGDLIQATGTVQEFSQINNDDVASDLNAEFFSPFEGGAALVADSVTITPQQGGGTTMQANQGVPVSLSAITDQPTEFYGQTVTVSGPVARVVEPNAYVIVSDQTMDGGEALEDVGVLANQGVLIVDQSGASVNEGETSQVTGVVQQFDLDQIEEDVGVALENPNNEVYSAFEGRPAIVVGAQGGSTSSTTQ